MKNSDFGNKLMIARKAKCWTQMDLAERSNISLRTIQRIESGQVHPRAYTLKRLSEILEMDLSELLDDFSDCISDNRHSDFGMLKLILWHISDLFNLKTNAMKKVTILSSMIVIATFCLFNFLLNSKGQNRITPGIPDCIEINSKRIIYLIPRLHNTILSNMKDTADLRVDNDLIQEYHGKIFLNKKYLGKALEGDTVKYKLGKLTIIQSYYLQPSSYRKDIFYLFPKGQIIDNMSLNEGTEYFKFSGHTLKEKDNMIYMDDLFIGKVHAGDSVIYSIGKVKIL